MKQTPGTTNTDLHTLELLDYFLVRSTIAGFCMSAEGKDMLLQRLPSFDPLLITEQKAQSQDWMNAIESSQPAAMVGWPEVFHLFAMLAVEGTTLAIEEAYALGQFCRSVAKMQAAFSPFFKNNRLPQLKKLIEKLPSLAEAEKQIFTLIDDKGQIRDVGEIPSIKKKIAQTRSRIDTLIKNYTTNAQLRDSLQSDVPTIRGDRQVLAVKANFRGRIKGIVHEVSQTGQTLYIEPADVVQANNDLVQEEYNLLQEIRRLMKELTARLSEWHLDFIQAHEQMIVLDTAYAAARWGIQHRCTFAFLRPTLSLVQARHPLLGDKAVPIDLSFLPEKRILIITGPNTGGKTVALKTVALFAALNQSGFPLPAKEGTALPLFDRIFADIGDEQSLHQSLSTFSGHMKNIAGMTLKATEHSLILLDELGSGTDPQEGGAIAMAVLDYLIEKKALVLVTTHHGILKNYGYTHPQCINASVDFDQNTLSPTYRILMGIPGESHALEIARRNGLIKPIADKAAHYLVTEQADVSRLIQGLTAKHSEMDALEQEQQQKEAQIREKWRRVDLKELALKQKELELQEQGFRRLASFADESRKMLENLVRELREGEITREKTLKVKDYISQLSQSLEDERLTLAASQEQLDAQTKAAHLRGLYDKPQKEKGKKQRGKPITAATDDCSTDEQSLIHAEGGDFKPGVQVAFGKNRQNGTLVRQEKKDSWIVQTGSLKLTVKEKDLIMLKQTASPPPSIEFFESTGTGLSAMGTPAATAASYRPDPAVFELRLLGMRLDEALKTLEVQMDAALMQGLKHFSVIHGKGNGVLQTGVHEYLSKCLFVDSYHFAPPEAGGSGKTYVHLK